MSDGGEGDVETIPLAEKVAMAASVLFTLSLFGFALWHSFTGAGTAAPTVGVAGSEETPTGVRYTVELRNPGDVGFVSVTVRAGCTDPPTEVTFENVPAGGRRRATVVCPPGTSDPAVSVLTWMEE